MLITAKGFIKDPKTGEEKEITLHTGLHGQVDRAMAEVTVKELVQQAKLYGCDPLRIEGFTAENHTEWRPDHFT